MLAPLLVVFWNQKSPCSVCPAIVRDSPVAPTRIVLAGMEPWADVVVLISRLIASLEKPNPGTSTASEADSDP